MSRIKISTLTSVHIGSGVFLQNGSDFVVGKDVDGYAVIGIISPKKILNLIGSEKSKINEWVAGIERGKQTEEIVKRYAPKATIEDYCERIILNWSKVKPNETLKEYIHDGLGRPYIPGSSIKGAIRTAILSRVSQSVNAEFILNREGGRISASSIEKEVFGQDPNKDIFRFLKVGDALFSPKDDIVAIKMVNINERNSNSYWDESKAQLIEALASENESHFSMKIDLSQYEKARRAVHAMPNCMQSIPNLFKAINDHTAQLIDTEISYWDGKVNDPNADRVEDYLDKLRAIKNEVNSCKGTSCVLRIGHGSGWRFITGAWTENMSIFRSRIVPAARPKNGIYTEYSFPKSRRVDDECELLGFVRLTLETE